MTTVEEKILALANSLKSMHLAASMDEALARARDIILSTPVDNETSVNEVTKRENPTPTKSEPASTEKTTEQE